MSKVLFMNSSPNKNGNTYRIGEELLKNVDHDVLHMADYQVSQYGAVHENDQIKEIFKVIEDKDTLVIGTCVYWYTVSGILKTFIDRLYLLPEAEVLKGKKLYLFAQGTAPDEATKQSITFLAKRVAALMGMELKGVVVDTSDGNQIIYELKIC
ncbi:MAG: flavodoxin family protein [Traorella sp.]